MKIDKKLSLISIALSVALSGCIEVDDDSNAEVAAALTQQNALLAEQNALLDEQNETSTVTLSGLVMDVAASQPVGAAEIKVLQGDTVLVESVAAEAGIFTVEGLPSSSDIIIEVSSPDDAFMSRAFFYTTLPVSDNDRNTEMGTLWVSQATNVTFAVTNSETGETIGDLEFSGFDYQGNDNETYRFNYELKSSFNAETGLYEITLPRDLSVSLSANIDQENDGQRDFDQVYTDSGTGYIAGNEFVLNGANDLEDGTTFELRPYTEEVDAVIEEKSLTILLLDEQGSPLEGALFSTQSGNEDSIYNPDLGSYEITIPFEASTSLNMSSFTADGQVYSSGSISIYESTNSQTEEVRLNISTSGFNSNSSYQIADAEEITIVLEARAVQPSSNVEVVSTFLDSDYGLDVFYSEPVTIDESEVSLTYSSVKVTYGNASTDDTIPPGQTVIESVEQSTDVSLVSSLDGVKFELTPQAALLSNTRYSYDIGAVAAVSDGVEVVLDSDDFSFTSAVDETQVFDINDVVLDNLNFYSNGEIIVSENTAGVENTRGEYRENVNFLLPTSIEALEYMSVRLVSYTNGSQVNPYDETFTFVSNGSPRYQVRGEYALEVAYNEAVVNQGVSYIRGASLPNGTYVYRQETYIYLNDNQPSEPHTVTFYYEYITKAGESESGILTLPVN